MDSDVQISGTEPAPATARVIVADDHAGYRDGVARLINAHPGLTVVGVAADGARALEMIAELKPDVALLDVRMPEHSGIDVCRLLRDSGRAPATRVLLITGTPDPVLSARAAEAGAFALIGKETSPRLICEQLLAAAER